MSDHGLVLGALDLIDDQSKTYELHALAEGHELGNPEPIEVAIRSLLQDGSILYTQGYDNRTVNLRIEFRGDGPSLADAEGDLFSELGRRNTLTWTPPNGGIPTVFDVITSSLNLSPDDEADVRGVRVYSVRLVCEPWGRSVADVVIPALAPPPSTPVVVVVDDCGSLTGWGYYLNPDTIGEFAVDTSGGDSAIRLQSGPLSSGVAAEIALTRTGSVDLSATKYVSFDYVYLTNYGYSGLTDASASAGSSGSTVPLELVAIGNSPFAGYYRATFRVPAGVTTVGSLRFLAATTANQDSIRAIRITQVSRSDAPPVSGTRRQSFRSLVVPGSAPTTGSLHVYHPSAALGTTLIYTCKQTMSAYQPPLRVWRTAGPAETPDTSTISGGRSSLLDINTFQVPSVNVPRGRHDLWAFVRSTVAGEHRVRCGVYALVGSTLLGLQAGYRTVTLAADTWTMVRVSSLALPPVTLPPGSAAKVKFDLLCDVFPTGAAVELDEAWTFCTEDDFGDLTIVECGSGAPATGGPASQVWVNSATTDRPLPQVLVGSASNGSDAYGSTGVVIWAQPRLNPGPLNLFLATSGAVDAKVDLTVPPRWFTHAAF